MIKPILNKVRRKLIYYKNRVYQLIKLKALVWVLKKPSRGIIYYALFDRSFDRELYSVLYGKYLHINGHKNSLAYDATLRRNIHRLEKGLINDPLKPIFALDYISETIIAYEKILEQSNDNSTLKWAHDVLASYFQVVTSDKVKDVRSQFEDLKENTPLSVTDVKQHLPYARKEGTISAITYDEFYKLCQQRRSIRWYQNKPVPIHLVERAVLAANLSPSACNRQPFRFIIIDEIEKLKSVRRLPAGTDSFADNIPMMAIIIGDLSAYFDERDRHIIYIDGSLAAMSFMLALETLGLSSCPINWPDIENREKQLSETLNLKPNERCIMFISIGYALPNGKIPFSQKKSISNVLKYYGNQN